MEVDGMNFSYDGFEIDEVVNMEVYGDWLRFTDSEGATVKITPNAVKTLMIFAINNFEKFDKGAWE
jgi:hypothetical protein